MNYCREDGIEFASLIVRLRDDIKKKKRVKNGTLAQKVGRYQNKIPIQIYSEKGTYT